MNLEFDEFRISDMIKEISDCKYCKEGIVCIAHKFTKKHNNMKKKMEDRKQRLIRIRMDEDGP